MVGWRNSAGERPLGRVAEAEDEEGLRCASRYGAGESFANVSGGNERAEGVADVVAMMSLGWRNGSGFLGRRSIDLCRKDITAAIHNYTCANDYYRPWRAFGSSSCTVLSLDSRLLSSDLIGL